jgi:hypothetical protein
MAVADLAVQEAATVAEKGVVGAELMAVVAERQQRAAAFEAAVGLFQMRITHRGGIEPQLPENGIVAEAQGRAREGGGLHHVPEVRPQAFDPGLERQAQQGIGHGAAREAADDGCGRHPNGRPLLAGAPSAALCPLQRKAPAGRWCGDGAAVRTSESRGSNFFLSRH